MRISDWSSDLCSSDLQCGQFAGGADAPAAADARSVRFPRTDDRAAQEPGSVQPRRQHADGRPDGAILERRGHRRDELDAEGDLRQARPRLDQRRALLRSEEHTSELQSLMRISYAAFCLKKKKKYIRDHKMQNKRLQK